MRSATLGAVFALFAAISALGCERCASKVVPPPDPTNAVPLSACASAAACGECVAVHAPGADVGGCMWQRMPDGGLGCTDKPDGGVVGKSDTGPWTNMRECNAAP